MKYLLCFVVGGIAAASAQNYATHALSPALLENANAVVRQHEVEVDVQSQDRFVARYLTAVTVLNESGLNAVDLSAHYTKSHRITKIEATVYDASGNEMRKIRRKDFSDVSVADGFSVFSDDRMLYYDYTPVRYPFTVVFQHEIRSSNTAFLPRWMPYRNYAASTQESRYSIAYDPALGFGYSEVNFDAISTAVKTENQGKLTYEVTNLPAIRHEDYSPDYRDVLPILYCKLEKFNLEGVNGHAADWPAFGKWYYETLLSGTDELPEKTVAAMRALVANETDPVAKARKIFKYMQSRTRYVSIQVGIGGFKPMRAQEVDKLGYGDCKALTNYTRALLSAVGVPSYYTIVHAGSTRVNLVQDFASVQGNHVILALPVEDGYVFMECTDQKVPFNFNGSFTDGRNVLIVKPEGGELVQTPFSKDENNSQITRGYLQLNPSGDIVAKVQVVSTGTQYQDAYRREDFDGPERERFYKNYLSQIGNLRLGPVRFHNDAREIKFTQDIELSAATYASHIDGKFVFVPNAFNNNPHVPKRYRTRYMPVQISRGYLDRDEIEIRLPSGYAVESLPQPIVVSNAFGTYKMEIEKLGDGKLLYKREFLLKEGRHDKSAYESLREFRDLVSRYDNAKIALIKT